MEMLADDLVNTLHYAATDGGNRAAARRTATKIWLENAAYRQADHTILLRYLSTCHLGFIDVAVDSSSGLVYTESSSTALDDALSRVNSKLALSTGGKALPTLLHIVALLSRELGADSETIWIGAGAYDSKDICIGRPLPFSTTLSAHIGRALLSAAAHPGLAASAILYRLESALAGLHMHVSLMATALQALRRQMVCHPVPPYFMPRSTGHSGLLSSHSVDSPIGSQRDFDAKLLSQAIAGLPSPAAWMQALLRSASKDIESDASREKTASAAMSCLLESLHICIAISS